MNPLIFYMLCNPRYVVEFYKQVLAYENPKDRKQ